MREPVLASPLDPLEKKDVFENVSEDTSEQEMLGSYIERFIAKNGLQGYETSDITKRKLLASLVLAAAVFFEIVFIALYHKTFVFILILLEIMFYNFFFRQQNLKRYLIREVVRRPDDNLDNILISQVSGAKKGAMSRILALLPLIAAAAVSLMLFQRPHMIFEANASGGYSLRYYTMALSPEKLLVIPEEYKGLPVTELRGNVFQNIKSLERITLPSGLTEIRASTFEKCSGLQEIEIPEGVTRIAAHAFCDCSSLSKVTVPSTVTEIGSSAFRRCSSLDSIDIPAQAEVHEKAFKESPTTVNRY